MLSGLQDNRKNRVINETEDNLIEDIEKNIVD
jgi:hypothetical protein